MTVHTIVPALALSGQGRRLCALEHLGERTLLAHLLETLHQIGLSQPLVLVPAQKADQVSDIDLPPHRVVTVPGADPDRREGLRCALAELGSAGPEQTVMIHDAERALVPADTIQAVLEADDPSSVDGVVPVIDMTDSVKAVRSEGLVNIDRSTLATVQCPRLLRRSVLDDALAQPAPAGCGAGHGIRSVGAELWERVSAREGLAALCLPYCAVFFAGRGLGRPPHSHSKGRGGPIGCLRVNIAALFILYVGCP